MLNSSRFYKKHGIQHVPFTNEVDHALLRATPCAPFLLAENESLRAAFGKHCRPMGSIDETNGCIRLYELNECVFLFNKQVYSEAEQRPTNKNYGLASRGPTPSDQLSTLNSKLTQTPHPKQRPKPL